MEKNISICGTDCYKCYCYGKKCKGCNEVKGIVFYSNGKECPIYHCCKNECNIESCSKCNKVPCEIWIKNRDPKFTDEEFANNIKDRLENLKK